MNLDLAYLKSLVEQSKYRCDPKICQRCDNFQAMSKDGRDWVQCIYIPEDLEDVEQISGIDVPKECPYMLEQIVIGKQDHEPKTLEDVIADDEELLILQMEYDRYGFDDGEDL